MAAGKENKGEKEARLERNEWPKTKKRDNR